MKNAESKIKSPIQQHAAARDRATSLPRANVALSVLATVHWVGSAFRAAFAKDVPERRKLIKRVDLRSGLPAPPVCSNEADRG